MLNRTEAPIRHDIQGVELIHPEKISFKNGVEVLIFQAPAQALVKAEFIFRNFFSEAHFSDPENSLRHTCMNQMLKEGTHSRNSAQIADEVDFYGAYLMPEYSFDHSALSLYSLNKHLHQLLPLVHDILNNSSFPQEELDTYIRNHKQTLQISLQKNEYLARRSFFAQLFGGTRYGALPSEASYDALNREELVYLYQQQINPANCTLILSGNITSEVLQQVRQLFENQWEAKPPVTATIDPTFAPFEASSLIEERSDSLQSAIRMGMPSINRTHPDFPGVQFVNTLFGGYFGSRLMRNIREEKGYTYGIGSAFASLQHSGFFTLSTEVGVDKTQDTLQEIEKEFKILRETSAPVQEIELVKQYILGSVLGSVESIFSHADKYKAVYFHDMDLSYYQYYDQVVRSMNAAEVQRLAQQYFDYDQLFKVVVGKLS